jgi:small GTP-binding protein
MFHEIRRPDGVQICLQIWDTAGQERYHSVSQLFYRDADVAFVCWEAGNDESLESVVDWVAKVRCEVPDCMFVFVATKCDLLDDQHCQLLRATAQKMFASYQPKGIHLTSAITRQGVEELFRSAAELYGVPAKAVTGPNPVDDQTGARPRCCS